jgi:hypothetical protein
LLEAFDLVKEIGQTCESSATVRPACRTLDRRMVTAAKPVYSTFSRENQEEYTVRLSRVASVKYGYGVNNTSFKVSFVDAAPNSEASVGLHRRTTTILRARVL